MMTLSELHAWLPGSRLVGGRADAGDPHGAEMVEFERVHSDTRTLRAGDLFVALRGERFDANDFLAQARAAGAVAALCEREPPADLPAVVVPDALAALQQFAAAWRSRLELPLVAVTGSNGKTTVTQMVAAIGRAWLGEGMLATQGNFNNHIGVPLTLLRLRQDNTRWHRAAVLELGTNHVGEIAQLAQLVQPTVALVNNAQREHQEFLDGVEAVARENGSVLDALPTSGTAVLPAADAFTPLWRTLAGHRRVMSFGLDVEADVRGHAAWQADEERWIIDLATPLGPASATLRQPGRHNVLNALAATACALAAGAPLQAVQRGLESFQPVAGRSRQLALQVNGQRVLLIDDSYNANPDSVRAAIDVLATLPAPRWLLLGDMGEVGAQGPQFHAEVGAYARERGIELLWSAGDLSAGLGHGLHFKDTAALVAALPGPGQAWPATSVLVKGSRFMRMEQVVQALAALASDSAGAARAAQASGGPHAA